MLVSEKKNQFISPDQWRLSLPDGWTVLAPVDGNPLNTNRPIVFCAEASNPDAPCLTWMRADRPATSDAWLQFCTSTMLSGTIGSREAQAAVLTSFPIAGKVVEASAVRLPDGNKAIELIEEITDESGAVTSAGYQLIFSCKTDEPGAMYMQRLVFYSNSENFKQMLPVVRDAARSFEYF